MSAIGTVVGLAAAEVVRHQVGDDVAADRPRRQFLDASGLERRIQNRSLHFAFERLQGLSLRSRRHVDVPKLRRIRLDRRSRRVADARPAVAVLELRAGRVAADPFREPLDFCVHAADTELARQADPGDAPQDGDAVAAELLDRGRQPHADEWREGGGRERQLDERAPVHRVPWGAAVL